MTDHEVNEARVKEAIRLWQAGDYPKSFNAGPAEPSHATVARIAMQLEREGWLPSPDRLLVEARKIGAACCGAGAYSRAEADSPIMKIIIHGLRRGIEIGKGMP